jgi:hypothetical protein
VGISFSIENNVLHLNLDGELTKDDVLGFRARVQADPSYWPGMPELVDCRGLSTLFSADDLRALAARMERPASPRPWRCAVLVSSDVVYGLARMYDAFVDAAPIEVRPFRDPAEATAWLTS